MFDKKQYMKEYLSTYYKNNKEKIKKRSSLWRVNNYERYIENGKKYRLKNKDRIAEIGRDYRKRIAETLKVKKKAYVQKNKNKPEYKASMFLAKKHNYILGFDDKEQTRNHLIKLYKNNICNYCGINPKTTIHVDHVIKRSDPASSNNPDNLQSLCANCHAKKID